MQQVSDAYRQEMTKPVLGAAKLRCPHCGKVLFQEAVKLRLAGETTCPKCGKSVTFQ